MSIDISNMKYSSAIKIGVQFIDAYLEYRKKKNAENFSQVMLLIKNQDPSEFSRILIGGALKKYATSKISDKNIRKMKIELTGLFDTFNSFIVQYSQTYDMDKEKKKAFMDALTELIKIEETEDLSVKIQEYFPDSAGSVKPAKPRDATLGTEFGGSAEETWSSMLRAAKALRKKIIAKTTGQNVGPFVYENILRSLMKDDMIKDLLPVFVKECASLEECSKYLKERFKGDPSARAQFVEAGFDPLIMYLEDKK